LTNGGTVVFSRTLLPGVTVDTCTVYAGEWESFSFNRYHLAPSAVYPRIVTEHQVPLLISDCNNISLADTCVTNQLNSTRCVVRSCNCCCHGNGTVASLYIVVELPTLSHCCRHCKCKWVCLHVKRPILLSSFSAVRTVCSLCKDHSLNYV
jgi:hypothetical protein